MAQSNTQKAYTNFNKGLLTERSEVNFPDGYSVDELNMEPQKDGSIKRRAGVTLEAAIEDGPTLYEGAAVTTHEWENVGRNPNKTYTAIQRGIELSIFDRQGTLLESGVSPTIKYYNCRGDVIRTDTGTAIVNTNPSGEFKFYHTPEANQRIVDDETAQGYNVDPETGSTFWFRTVKTVAGGITGGSVFADVFDNDEWVIHKSDGTVLDRNSFTWSALDLDFFPSPTDNPTSALSVNSAFFLGENVFMLSKYGFLFGFNINTSSTFFYEFKDRAQFSGGFNIDAGSMIAVCTANNVYTCKHGFDNNEDDRFNVDVTGTPTFAAATYSLPNRTLFAYNVDHQFATSSTGLWGFWLQNDSTYQALYHYYAGTITDLGTVALLDGAINTYLGTAYSLTGITFLHVDGFDNLLIATLYGGGNEVIAAYNGLTGALVWAVDVSADLSTTLGSFHYLSQNVKGTAVRLSALDSNVFGYMTRSDTTNEVRWLILNPATGARLFSGDIPTVSSSWTENPDEPNNAYTNTYWTGVLSPQLRTYFDGTQYVDPVFVYEGGTIDLSYIQEGERYWTNPQEFPVQTANSNGELIVASRGIDTIRISEEEDGTFAVRPVCFFYRDFSFADKKELYVAERPVGDFTAAVCYDIVNHGYSTRNGAYALERYISAKRALPPLTQRWYSSKDEYNKFDVGGFASLNAGTSIVGNGHFILNLYKGERSQKLRLTPFDENFDPTAKYTVLPTGYQPTSPDSSIDAQSILDQSIEDFKNLFSAAGENAELTVGSLSSGTVTGNTDSAFYDVDAHLTATPTFREYYTSIVGTEKANWELKNFQDTAGTSEGNIFDYIKMYEDIYYITPIVGGGDLIPELPTVDGNLPNFDDEVDFDKYYAIDYVGRTQQLVTKYTGTIEDIPETTRFSSVCSFGGRLFYSGLTSKRNTSSVFFSQLLYDDNDFAGSCYQEADPTAEVISDIVDTDGGVIKINGAYNIQRLHPLKDRILVFAENGVWAISGIEGFFTPSSFQVEKITDVGITYEQSFVSADSRPYWWNERGIYTIQFSSEAGTLDAANMTEMTIQSFYDEIDPDIKRRAQGIYDRANKRVTWMYGTSGLNDGEYNKLLHFDEQLASWTPWEVASLTINTPYIVGAFVRDGKTIQPNVEFTVIDKNGDIVVDSNGDTVVVTGDRTVLTTSQLYFVVRDSNGLMRFATLGASDYTDWNDATNFFRSYVETPYDFQGDMSVKKNAEYCTIFAKVTESGFEDTGDGLTFTRPSGGKFSAYWDFRTDASMSDQVFYRLKNIPVPEGEGDVVMPRTVTASKMRLKGKGRVVRLRFDAEDGKDMHLLGYEMIGLRNNRY